MLLKADVAGAELLLCLGAEDERRRGGRLPPLFLLEALTQAAAAYHGVTGRGTTETGVLAEVTRAVFHAAASAGDEVLLRVERGPALGPLVRLRGRATTGGKLLVEGEFTVMRTVS